MGPWKISVQNLSSVGRKGRNWPKLLEGEMTPWPSPQNLFMQTATPRNGNWSRLYRSIGEGGRNIFPPSCFAPSLTLFEIFPSQPPVSARIWKQASSVEQLHWTVCTLEVHDMAGVFVAYSSLQRNCFFKRRNASWRRFAYCYDNYVRPSIRLQERCIAPKLYELESSKLAHR